MEMKNKNLGNISKIFFNNKMCICVFAKIVEFCHNKRSWGNDNKKKNLSVLIFII